jgi:uncharacterized membrane protein YfcA
MGAYIVSGIVGLHAYARAGSIRWRETSWTWAGALPCAFAGASSVPHVPVAWLELAIGVLSAGAGLYVLAERRARRTTRVRLPTAPALAGIGAVTGFLSALTGTGGPLVIMPRLRAYTAMVLVLVGGAMLARLALR